METFLSTVAGSAVWGLAQEGHSLTSTSHWVSVSFSTSFGSISEFPGVLLLPRLCIGISLFPACSSPLETCNRMVVNNHEAELISVCPEVSSVSDISPRLFNSAVSRSSPTILAVSVHSLPQPHVPSSSPLILLLLSPKMLQHTHKNYSISLPYVFRTGPFFYTSGSQHFRQASVSENVYIMVHNSSKIAATK